LTPIIENLKEFLITDTEKLRSLAKVLRELFLKLKTYRKTTESKFKFVSLFILKMHLFTNIFLLKFVLEKL
jgi:hypothetical protein